MPAYSTINVGMKGLQYTIRKVPRNVDDALRRRAKQTGKSLNQVLLESLRESAGVSEEAARYSDLDDLAGTWKNDKAFEEAIRSFEKIDQDDWK